jgi:hypothetical protein
MPLQNRVTPFGDIVALGGRGLMMGNRGILHDDRRTIRRAWQVRRWIACVIEFHGRRRQVMRPHSYTELFFLDEAAALSAGHRPCAECRRADYRRFRSAWESVFGGSASADAIDDRLHDDRLDERRKRTYRVPISDLPDGAYVALDGSAWLVLGPDLLAWSDTGYTKRRPKPAPNTMVEALTPRSTVAVLAAGYRCSVHPSAVDARSDGPSH